MKYLKLKNIRLRVLLVHLIITLGYPLARAVTAERNRLQLFTDAMTWVALVLLIGGVVYGMVLHGDFDISSFVFRRGARKNAEQSYSAYRENQKEEREEAFNYPLFLGIVYLIASAVIAYGVL